MHEVKLGVAQRHRLVKGALRRVKEANRGRNGELSAAGPDFASGSFMVYKDEVVEERFMRFIHSAPLGAILLLHLVSAGSGTAWMVAKQTPISLTMGSAFVVTSLIEIYIHVAARRLPDGNSLHRLLHWERVFIVGAMGMSTSLLVIFSYQALHECGVAAGWKPVGAQPKFFIEGYCQYWSGLISIIFGVVAVLQVVRFSMLFGMAIITVTIAATAWIVPSLRPQRDDVAAVIMRVNLMTIAACAFACFIRYIDEKQQRRHFEVQEKLLHSAEVLATKRVATLERFLAILPQAVTNRLRDGQWQRAQIDVASDATVLVTRIHDFPTWSTSMVPLQVAAMVASMQNEVATLLLAGRLERVGRLGDTTVAVGNLLERLDENAAPLTINAAKKIVALDDACVPGAPTLVAAVHIGSVEGVLQGDHYVRYEVRGPAVEATRCGVQLCGNSGRLLASTAITAATAEDDSEWCEDSEALVVEAGAGDRTTFRRLDPQLLPEAPQVPSAPHTLTALVVTSGDDARFVSGVSRLLGQRSAGWSNERSLTDSTKSLNRSGTRLEQSSSETSQQEPLGIVADRLGFYRFADEEADRLFRQRRMNSVPQQAAKVWLGYAAFGLLILLVLLLELQGPHAAIGAVLLVLGILGSTCLAVVPSALGDKRMAALSVPWTVAGMFVPLLMVFGCALSRPSLVGLDVRPYVAFGAFMRSYCFNDARIQAIAVPAFSLISSLQYLTPGVHENISFLPLFLIFILATILAARNREGSELKNYQRDVITEAVVQQIEEVSRVQQGLLRSSLPRCVFDAAVAADFQGPRAVHQALAVVMVIRAATPSRPFGFRNGGGGLGRVLDEVTSTAHLSTAGVLGDDAVVVGPVPTSPCEDSSVANVEEASLREALVLGLAITHDSPVSDAPALSVLVDQDTVAHVVELGAHPNYSLLGISAIRLICVGADVSGIVRGLLVTERVTAMVNAFEVLGDVTVEVQAPMSVRGQGVLRWNRIRKH